MTLSLSGCLVTDGGEATQTDGDAGLSVDTDNEYVTLINVFTPGDSDDQQRVVDLLVEFLDGYASQASGFHSAAVHRSRDSGQVATYARWESVDAIRQFRDETPEAAALVGEMTDIATSERHPYEVVEVFERTDAGTESGG